MSDLKLWYDEAAREWVEALPIGNGRLGAMVFGGVAREHLQLNESTLWSGGPYSPVNPEALPNLEAVRDLIFAGRYAEAEALANQHLMAKPHRQMSYQPAGDLWLDCRSRWRRSPTIAANSIWTGRWRPRAIAAAASALRARCSFLPSMASSSCG